MRIIRASEIGAFVYCQRAWWLQRRGIKSANSTQMTDGLRLHRQHGRAVARASFLRRLAFGLISLALVLLAVGLTLGSG